MAHYALPDHLSLCRSGDRLVFLDVDRDRYFSLPDPLDQALDAHLHGQPVPAPAMRRLVERGILIESEGPAVDARPAIPPVQRSAMEAPPLDTPLRLADLAEVSALVIGTRIALKRRPLRRLLDGLSRQRPGPTSVTEDLEPRLIRAVDTFRRARLFAPVPMRCLLDSIAMTRYLRRRDLHAHVVFGVASDPFSAHCWVQAGDIVLNDTAGNVTSHTPIRVV